MYKKLEVKWGINWYLIYNYKIISEIYVYNDHLYYWLKSPITNKEFYRAKYFIHFEEDVSYLISEIQKNCLKELVTHIENHYPDFKNLTK